MDNFLDFLSSKLGFLLLSKTFKYPNNLSELQKAIKSEDYGFSGVYYRSSKELEFRSLFGLGTLQVNNQPTTGIIIYGEVLTEGDEELTLRIYTKITDGMLFATVLPIIIVLGTWNSAEFPLALKLVLLGIPLFFFWIYRAQESALMKAVSNQLRLKKFK